MRGVNMLAEWVKKKTERLPWIPAGKGEWMSLKSPWILGCLAVVGIIFLMWPSSGSPDGGIKRARPTVETVAGGSLQAAMEQELAGILSQVEGAGRVDVSLTLASEGIKTYAYNRKEESRALEETDRNGGSRRTTETSSSRDVVVSSNQTPLLVEKKPPLVKGVLVVADGAYDPVVREQMTKAVITLLDIPASRVMVLPRSNY